MGLLDEMGKKAKLAARILGCAPASLKNSALNMIADDLENNTEEILSANAVDLDNGKRNGLTQSLLDRLALSPERIKGMADGVRDVARFDDPVGKIISGKILPNGLQLEKVAVPLGVIGIIFEARPNVTSDAAALCLKSGNVCILRGGKEAINSNMAISRVMRKAIEKAGLPVDCVSLIEDTSRETATELMRLNQYLDCLIPRGGAGLINSVVQNSTVPVIETGTGNCHIYVEKTADINMAADIVYNSKTSRPSVCNAAESLLVDKDIAEKALPVIAEKLALKNTQIRGCERTCKILSGCIPATDEDYATEFLDYIISVKVVDDISEAVGHIAKYSSGHSECIVTNDYNASAMFTSQVDSAAVYVNASTRFTDGAQFGMGAEIGISTQKLHARGPMGLNELTSMKFIIKGTGQIR